MPSICSIFLSQHDRLDDTLHRHRRHHGDRQHVVKPGVLWHISRTEISTSLNLKMGQGVPRTWFRSPCVFSFSSTTVPQRAENTVHKWGDRKFRKKKTHFCELHFSLGEKQILETRCIKQHAFFGRATAWFICGFFECSHFDVIWPTKKGGSNQERRSKLRSRVEISITRTFQKGPIPTEKGAKSKILKESPRRRQEDQAPGDRLPQKIFQVKRKVIFIQTQKEKSTSRSSTILQRISSWRRARILQSSIKQCMCKIW